MHQVLSVFLDEGKVFISLVLILLPGLWKRQIPPLCPLYFGLVLSPAPCCSSSPAEFWDATVPPVPWEALHSSGLPCPSCSPVDSPTSPCLLSTHLRRQRHRKDAREVTSLVIHESCTGELLDRHLFWLLPCLAFFLLTRNVLL